MILQIETNSQGIFALTSTSLRHQIRRGIPKWTYTKNLSDALCMFPMTARIKGNQEVSFINFQAKVQVVNLPSSRSALDSPAVEQAIVLPGSNVVRCLRELTEIPAAHYQDLNKFVAFI